MSQNLDVPAKSKGPKPSNDRGSVSSRSEKSAASKSSSAPPKADTSVSSQKPATSQKTAPSKTATTPTPAKTTTSTAPAKTATTTAAPTKAGTSTTPPSKPSNAAKTTPTSSPAPRQASPSRRPSPANIPSAKQATSTSSAPSEKLTISNIFANYNTRFQDGEILTCTKEAKERLLLLNDKLKECLDKQFHRINQARKDDEKNGPKEMIVFIKVLVGRLQLGIYDSHLMMELCHYLQSYTVAINKCKEAARKLLVENGKIRDQIAVQSNEAYEKENQLASTYEMLGYWEFMAETACSDISVDENALTRHDLWRGVYDYDDRDLRDILYDLREPDNTLFQNVRRLMAGNNIHDAIKTMKSFLKSNNCRKNESVAHILIVMANYCHDAEMYEDALDALVNARLIMNAVHGASSKLSATVSCRMASIHVSDQAWSHAASILQKAIIEHSADKDSENSPFFCRLFFNMGYCLLKMKEIEKGFRIMELAVIALSKMLPKHDHEWAWCCFLLAKLLNNNHFYAAACFLTSEAIEYVLDNSKDAKGRVYESAVLQDEYDVKCRPEDVPPGFYMPPVYQEILGEMRMAFCGMARIAACDLVDRYIDEVKKFDMQMEFTEEEFRKEKTRLMDNKQRKVRESYIQKAGPTSIKGEFKISQVLVTLLHRHYNASCPLEYKVVENRGKICRFPIKNLQMIVKQEIQVDAPIKRMKEDPKKTKEREKAKKKT